MQFRLPFIFIWGIDAGLLKFLLVYLKTFYDVATYKSPSDMSSILKYCITFLIDENMANQAIFFTKERCEVCE